MITRLAAASAAVLIVNLVLGGCATAPSTFYTLTSTLSAADIGAGYSDKGLAVGVGPVRFPEFLDRPQIVSRAGANRLALDEFHRWGGSLQDDFLRVLGENLGYLLRTSRILVEPAEARFPLDYRVIADVLSFEGTPDGEARFKVRWGVLDPYLEQVLVVREDTYRSPAGGEGQEAMIAALSETLAAFSRDVADQLRRLPKTKPVTGLADAL
jgi:uncharacterized lipoprotein YmbA